MHSIPLSSFDDDCRYNNYNDNYYKKPSSDADSHADDFCKYNNAIHRIQFSTAHAFRAFGMLL